MVQAFSGQVEAFKSEALECITFHYVHSIEDFENDRVTFKPQFAHQIFGEDETIFGYKDLAIDMYYTAGTLKCFIRVNYSGRIEESIEAKVDDDPQESLKKNFTNGIISSEFDFLKELKKDEAFKPHGMLLTQYSRYDDHKEKCFCLFKSDSTTPGFLSYHKDMQTFLTWFIDGSSFIEDDDPEWKFYTIYDKFSLNGNTRYAFVGYCTVYLFYCYPDLKRARVSQFLILPPYLRKGHGSQLLRMIYDDLKTMNEVQDITVEDPSEDFVSMRDSVDCQYIVQNFPAIMESPGKMKPLSKQLILQCQTATKINKKQFKHVYSILEFYFLNGKEKKAMQKYRKSLRDRIRKSLEQPKTKLSALQLKEEAAADYDENMDTDAAQRPSVLSGEYLETQVEEMYDRQLTHIMQVSTKLSSVL